MSTLEILGYVCFILAFASFLVSLFLHMGIPREERWNSREVSDPKRRRRIVIGNICMFAFIPLAVIGVVLMTKAGVA